MNKGMKNMKNNVETIEKYLNDELNDIELKNFERKIKADNTLAKEIGLHREVDNFLYDRETIELREKLSYIYDKTIIKEGNRKVFMTKKIVLLIAAVLLIIVGIGSLILLQTQSLTNQEIYTKYAQNYNIGSDIRSNSEIELKEAIDYYRNRQYKKALPLFEVYIDNKREINYGVYLCMGISYTETGKNEKAISYFNEIIKNSNIFIEQAQWYLGLSYLKADKTIKAKEIFEEISTDKKHYYNKKASEIMKFLSSQN